MTDNKFIKTIKNISSTIIANGISLLISVLLTLLLPKILSVQDYGYWQLYTFYIAYVGFFHFGWPDGIYLKYGGYDYNSLPKRVIGTQFWAITMLQIVISTMISLVVLISTPLPDKRFILIMAGICLVISTARLFVLQIYQASNRISEYVKYVKLDRYIYFLLLILSIIFGMRGYQYLIVIDLVAKLLSVIISIKDCKDLIFVRFISFNKTLDNAWDNIKIGSKLTFAGIASSLIVGVLRHGIENNWGIQTFAKVSLTINISNMLLTFINTVGLVLFPMLRTINEDNYARFYSIMRTILMSFLFIILIFYFPIKPFLTTWLPEYSEGLEYMSLLFPICVFESKTALLSNTYLKVLRQEKWIFITNIITLFLSLILTNIAIYYFNNLTWAILSFVFLIGFKGIVTEIITANILKIDINKEIIFEVLITISFIFSSWVIKGWSGALIYATILIIYLLFKKNEINHTIKFVRSFLVR